MRSGLSRATSRGLGLQRRTPRVLQPRSISVLCDGHDLHARRFFTGMHSDPFVGAGRPEATERRESIRRLHTPSSVTEDEPPEIPVTPALLQAISTCSLAQLQSILPISNQENDSHPQHPSSSSPGLSTPVPPRSYLLYLATQPPYHPPVLDHVLSLYPSSTFVSDPETPAGFLSGPDPPSFFLIDEFWRIHYSGSALSAAVSSDLPSMVAPFLAHGWPIAEEIPSPHEDDVYGNDTLLSLAISKGALKVAAYLIQNGADSNQELPVSEGAFPRTLMSRAAGLNDVKMLQLLRSHDGKVTGNLALYDAAFEGSLDAAEWLVSEGAEVGEVVRYINGELVNEGDDEDGRTVFQHGTPLHSAASGGKLDMAAWLLQKGVNKSVKDWQGRTALDIAKANENSEVADLIRGW